MSRKIIYVLLLFAILPILVFAGDGRIKGKVTDLTTGEALVGANVVVIGTSFGAATDVNGDYVIMNLDAGQHTVKASYLGFQSITITNVRVSLDLTTEVDFQLPAEEISVGTVTIVAQKPLITKDATSSIRNVSGEDISNLPVRGVTNIIGLQAGVVVDGGNIHIRGSRPDEVGYYLEGINIADPEDGGREITLSNDAIEELQVESGGFTAEFGGSNAGIIRSQLKSGTNDYHASVEYITDNVGFDSKDNFKNQSQRLGAYWYGYNETSFSLSGPVLENQIKFFYNLNYNFDRSQAKRAYPGFDLGLINDGFGVDTINFFYPAGVRQNQLREAFTHSGSITMDFNPILVRLTGTYSDGWNDVGGDGVFDILNNRISTNDWSNGSFSLKVKHVVTPNLFYELTGGLSMSQGEVSDPYLGTDYWAYGDSIANSNAGNVWVRKARELATWTKQGLTAADRRYIEPTDFSVYGYTFDADGAVSQNSSKFDQLGLTGRFDLTYLPSKHHNIKIGGEFKQYTLRNWSTSGSQSGFARTLANNLLKAYGSNPTQAQIDAEKAKILYTAGVNNYGYDVYGNEFDGDGEVNGVDGKFYAPHKPVEAGFYIQDKVEFDDIILNLGLRYDYFDMDNMQLINPEMPEDGVSDTWNSGELNLAGFKDVASFSGLSPRLSVSFPVTDRTVFHAGFGKYVQQPALDEAYLGYHQLAYQLGQSFFFSDPTGQNLRPIRKTHYEFGFRQQLTDFLAFDITGFYDDVKGQVFFNLQRTDANSTYESYNIKQNGDFATTKGVEIQLTMRRFQRLSGSASLSLQDAAGTGTNPNSNSGIVGAPLDGVTIFKPNYVAPLTYDRPLKGNIFLDYRFGVDDGPAVFEQLGVSILASFASGHPFTRGTGSAGMETDSRFRSPLEPLNSSLTPSTFNVDLKIDKSFRLFDQLYANVYVRVLNLFDNRNVEDVFKRTGAADDDGYLADPTLGGKKIEDYGPIFNDIYQALEIDYQGYYSNARQVLLGIRLEY
ncbi:MAG: TonB-dependent receptor [Ignavibacteriae bacterium]|nr:TonB-dependent receptor [Ignavibacteriota bacterium]